MTYNGYVADLFFNACAIVMWAAFLWRVLDGPRFRVWVTVLLAALIGAAYMAATLLLLGLLSAVEQMAVKRLTDDAMARTQEILSLLAQNQTARGLERAHEMDAWWDEEAPRVETLINHEATDDVRFTLSRLVAALEMGDRDGAFVYARELEGGIEHVLERQTLSWQNLL